MSIFPKIFGSNKAPSGLESVGEVNSALARLRGQREANAARHNEMLQARRGLIETDAPDAKIVAVDRELESLSIEEEKLDALEPRLLERLSQMQSHERRVLLETLEASIREKEGVLDSALGSTVEALQDFLAVSQQFDALGFSGEARSMFAAPPLLAGGILAGAEALENYRREKDRIAAMRGRLASGAPLRTAHPSLPTVSPAIAAANRAARKPAPRPTVSTEYRPQPTRAPVKIAESPSFGFTKIVLIRGGVELDGKVSVAGDEAIVAVDRANELMRSGAADLVEHGRPDAAAE